MLTNFNYIVSYLTEKPPVAKMLFMFFIMVASILAGYFACRRFRLDQRHSKTIMSLVLICFEWVIYLFVIWKMELKSQFAWLPAVGIIQLLASVFIAVNIFRFSRLDEKEKLTLMLAGGLSNLGYTGGLFIIYPLYGFQGLGIASLLLSLWGPSACFIFFPYLKARQMGNKYSFNLDSLKYLLDWRMLVIPAAAAGILLNICSVKIPAFITRFWILDLLIYTASALSFFAIGMRLRFSKLKNYSGLYLPLAAVKFIVLPLAALTLFGILGLFGFEIDGLIKHVILIFSICPSAVMMVTMSNIFDLNAEMASSLWVFTNIGFILVIVPILFFILR